MITTRDGLLAAMANNSSRLVIDKANIASQTAATFASLWRATGQPGQGAIPTAAAVCSNDLLGAFQFAQQTAPATSYGALLYAVCSNAAASLEIHDRLMHLGGLVGNVATSQTAVLDLNTNLATNNLDARKGDPNFSDVQWWLEWYVATGGTASNITINVTYSDASTGSLTAIPLAATRPASHMIPINSFIPAAASGLFIRAINSVQLTATTGTAGNFGITATRPRMTAPLPTNNIMWTYDWAGLGIPEIPNSACLFAVILTATTSTGTVRGGGKIAHG